MPRKGKHPVMLYLDLPDFAAVQRSARGKPITHVIMARLKPWFARLKRQAKGKG